MTHRPNPSADMTVADVKRFAKMYRVTVETHAPGDGVRRFTFVYRDGHKLGFALGIREAEVWLRGFMSGVDVAHSNQPDDDEPRTNPGDRVVHHVGAYVVTYNSELQEYNARKKGEPKDSGYFTSDKQDAIDTAETMAREGAPRGVHENPRHYDRRHPGYKGANIQLPETEFAYRGHLVKLGSDRETWYISKGGFHIGSATTAEKAREVIADLTRDTYRGER